MTRQEYIRQVARHLLCSSAGKREITRQLNSHIGSALEEGRSLEEILKEMGTPETLAEEFNDNFEEKDKKKAKRNRRLAVIGTSGLLVLVMAAVLIYWILPKERDIYSSKVFDVAQVKERTGEIVRLFGQGEDKALDGYLAPEVREALKVTTPDSIRQLIGDDWGDFQSMGNLYMTEISQKGKSYAVVQVNASFEHVSVTYTLTYNDKMELYGIYVK